VRFSKGPFKKPLRGVKKYFLFFFCFTYPGQREKAQSVS